MSNPTIDVATTGVVATARPTTMRPTTMRPTTMRPTTMRPTTMRIEGANGHLAARIAFRSPAPTFADVVGKAYATKNARDLQDPYPVSGKQLWSHPPV